MRRQSANPAVVTVLPNMCISNHHIGILNLQVIYLKKGRKNKRVLNMSGGALKLYSVSL